MAEEKFEPHLRPDLHVKKLQDNVLILQNYTDNNIALNSQLKFYNALKKEDKAELVQLHFFPEANLTAKITVNIGHFLSDEPWYLQEYTQTIVDFIEKTKNGRTIFPSSLPGSVQEMREFFYKTAFQGHSEESSQLKRWVSTGFKIYKNALQWRDPELRKKNTFEINPFMEKWFNTYKQKSGILSSPEAYALFLQKALNILSDDTQKADESWNSIYLNIIEEPNLQSSDAIRGLSLEMQRQLTIIYDECRQTLVETLKKSSSLIGSAMKKKILDAVKISKEEKQDRQLENLTTLLHGLKTKLINLLQAIKSLA